MSLKGVLKMLAAFFMSQCVSVVNQLLVPPLFLHRYPRGVEMYGEWVALTAAVSYLGTLNFAHAYLFQLSTRSPKPVLYSAIEPSLANEP